MLFISATDTNIGKTVVSSWLCLHLGFSYWKPIQTGLDSDSLTVKNLSGAVIIKEAYNFPHPFSPHLAASLSNDNIDLDKIVAPKANNVIIEGSGGLCVPINKDCYIFDIPKKLDIPILLVTRSSLGTINHTLLSINLCRSKNLKILGIVMVGEKNEENKKAIERYSNEKVILEFPILSKLYKKSLFDFKPSKSLVKFLSNV